jgi:hypothetical protein
VLDMMDLATRNAEWKAELMRYTNSRGAVPTIVRSDGSQQIGFPRSRLTRALRRPVDR